LRQASESNETHAGPGRPAYLEMFEIFEIFVGIPEDS
jgi:hypothetical protein